MFNVKFADIGEGIHEGIVYKMHAVVGENINEGDPLFLVETDKVTAEIPSPVSGKIIKVNAKEGDEILVGNTIIEIDDGSSEIRSNMESEETTSVQKEEKGASVVGEIEVSSELIASSHEVHDKKIASEHKKVLATPVARMLAKDLGIDITMINGSGPAGRVMKSDIYAADKQSKTVTNQVITEKLHDESDIERVPMSVIRKSISEHLVKSKFTIPHASVMDEVDVTELVEFKRSIKGLLEDEDVNLTYLSFIIKSVTIALKEHRIVNASMDDVNMDILYKNFINIGIAVDTPRGLMVPVIKRTDHLSIIDISLALKNLSEKAINKTIHLDELKGSTFTITNYGSFGASFGVPVINYPDSAVLGVGSIVKKPVVIGDDIVIRHMLPLSMSFDHRIIDGADAGRFMASLKKLLSTPKLLLLK